MEDRRKIPTCKVCGHDVITYRKLLICLNCSTVALEEHDRKLGESLAERFGKPEDK